MRAENISAKTAPRNTKTKNRDLTVLAVPYYSQLVRSNGGLEHIYFKLMADPITGESTKPILCVWNPKEQPSLPDWLCQQGVEAILCSDNRPGFEGLFSATGITIFWNHRGEAEDMVAQWFRSLPPEDHWQNKQKPVFA